MMLLKIYFILVLQLAISPVFSTEECVVRQHIKRNKVIYKYKQDKEDDNENVLYERGNFETINNKDTLWKLMQRLLIVFMDKAYEFPHQNDNYFGRKCLLYSNKFNFLLKNPYRNLVGSSILKYGGKYFPFAFLGPNYDCCHLNLHGGYFTHGLPEMLTQEKHMYRLKLKTLYDLLWGFPSKVIETLWKTRRKLYGTASTYGRLNSLTSRGKPLWINIPNLKSFNKNSMDHRENVIIATKFLLDIFHRRLPNMKFKNGIVTTKRKYSIDARFSNVLKDFQAETKRNMINLIDILSLYSENDEKDWISRMVNNENSNSLSRQYDRPIKHEDFLNIDEDYVDQNTISEMYFLLQYGRTQSGKKIRSNYRIIPRTSLCDSVIEHALSRRKRLQLQDNKRWPFSRIYRKCDTDDDEQYLTRRKDPIKEKFVHWRDGLTSLTDSSGDLNKVQTFRQIILQSFQNERRTNQGEEELLFPKSTNNRQHGGQATNYFLPQNGAFSYKPKIKRGFSMLTRLKLFSALDLGKNGYFNSRRLKLPNNGPIIYLNDNNVISAETRAMLRPLGTPLRWG